MLAPSVSYTTTKAYKSPESFIKTSLDTPSVTGGGAGAVVFKSITKTAGTGALKTALTLGAGAVGGALLFGGGGQEQKQTQETPIVQTPEATQDSTQRTMQLMRTILKGRQRYQAEAKTETDTKTDVYSAPVYSDITAGGDIFFGGSPVTTIPYVTPNIQQSPTMDISALTGAVAENRNILDQLTGALSQPTQTQEATKTTDWGMFALIGAGLLAVYMLFGRKKK